MALSKEEVAMYAYITGRVLPKGTTRRAFNLALAGAIGAGRRAAPIAARGALGAAQLAAANPVAAGIPLGAALGYTALATPPGQELLESAAESGRETRTAVDQAIDLALSPMVKTAAKRKATSKYNKAVSAAMKAVKASSKGGKKGTISNPKRVFSTVSKTVSKIARGKKPLKTGISGVAARAARKVLKRKPTYTFRKNK
jgi:hypothetical protein|tara:strand:- start:480 stop:1079 length:600 start_codon:yes stop_codon:yes gene_type:complete